MTIALTAVAFDHGLGGLPRYTLPLRVNERLPVSVPEWVRGMPLPSVAAYIQDRVPDVASVLARFAVTPGEPPVLEIRANASAAGGALEDGLLPDLPPSLVSFSRGDSGWCVFPLRTAPFADGGVGISVTEWTWQFRRAPGVPWIDFDRSVHKIYIVLSTPTAPWSVAPAGPSNPNLPWTDVLDIACVWARGARDVVKAASLVTKAVFDLGGELLTYDAPVGAPHYTVLGVPRFLCEAFIERVYGGEGAGPLVNCSDCATIVSTFANVLGADLWQSKMGLVAPRFALNPILGIGLQTWSTLWGGFTFHEVAWTGGCTEGDAVYDACLLTDADQDPTSAPQRPSLPTNQLFGRAGEGGYRDQLSAPSDRVLCVPQPRLRVRRSLTAPSLPAPSPFISTHLRSAAVRVRFDTHGFAPEAEDHFIQDFKFCGAELPGWSLTRLQRFATHAPPSTGLHTLAAGDVLTSRAAQPTGVHVTWWQSDDKESARLRVESFDTPSSADARNMLLHLTNEIECPLLKPWEGGAGDLAFKTPDGALVMFARGNHAHVVRSDAVPFVDVTEESKRLDEWLTGAGSPPATHDLSQTVRVSPAGGGGSAWTRLVVRGAQVHRDPDAVVIEPNGPQSYNVSVSVVEHTQAAVPFLRNAARRTR
ncbi:MAG: hypothetical protein ACJ74T_09960 [Pyrinomonadaceae bacterium]